jgi:hypothetical protein
MPRFPDAPDSSLLGFAFPITRDVGDHGDRRVLRATALCLRPSARHPPPIDVLLKTKAQPQFERPVDRLSPPLFLVFSGLNHVVLPCLSQSLSIGADCQHIRRGILDE